MDTLEKAGRLAKVFYQTRREATRLTHLMRQPEPSFSTRDAIKENWALRLLELMNIDVVRLDKPTSEEPAILVGNHLSYLDIIMLMSQIPVVFIAKKQLASWPIIGYACKSVGTLFIDRDKKDSRLELKALIQDCLKNSKMNVAIFPSGTTRLQEDAPWKWGGFQIAQDLNVPVRPFRLDYHPRREASFIDDDALVPHLWNLLGSKKITATLEIANPIPVRNPAQDAERLWKWSQEILTSHVNSP